MTKILEILEKFGKEMEKNNPFGLVLKGGTALSLYYLDNHRESEDLDIDADKKFIEEYKKIKEYLENILKKLKKDKTINNYKITKTGFASTDRYHIKLELKTYKTFYSKIDIDFVELPENLDRKGKLNLYKVERIFVTKAVTFINRKEFKDLYDIFYLIQKIDTAKFRKKEKLILLLKEVINVIQQGDAIKMYKMAFRNVDLRFKNLKEAGIEKFMENTAQKLRVMANKLQRQ